MKIIIIQSKQKQVRIDPESGSHGSLTYSLGRRDPFLGRYYQVYLSKLPRKVQTDTELHETSNLKNQFPGQPEPEMGQVDLDIGQAPLGPRT